MHSYQFAINWNLTQKVYVTNYIFWMTDKKNSSLKEAIPQLFHPKQVKLLLQVNLATTFR